MNFRMIAVLTSRKSWFVPYAKELVRILEERNLQPKLFFHHKKISENYGVVFVLSYFRIIGKGFIPKHKHNIIVHESDLPKGRGWAPLFWQILGGKKRIPIVLFEAAEGVDEGDIYAKDYIIYEGYELYDEIREKQGKKTIELCLRFLDDYKNLKPEKQTGEPTFYRKRTSADSELDINKTLGEQFNLLRIVDNKEFSAFFNCREHKYILKIYKEKS